MSTIHGASHQAIVLFRKRPAALAVYWVYCARRNHDGVAFPSLRGLAKDTGWSVNPCKKARDWLVSHGALEKLDGYIRPTWKKLDEEQRALLVNLDKSEYYRITGQLTLEGVTYDLLYAPASDVSLSDVLRGDTSSDVSPRATSHRMTQNLIPVNTQLDSTKEKEKELPSVDNHTSAAKPNGASPSFNLTKEELLAITDPMERKAAAKALFNDVVEHANGNDKRRPFTDAEMAAQMEIVRQKYGKKAEGV